MRRRAIVSALNVVLALLLGLSIGGGPAAAQGPNQVGLIVYLGDGQVLTRCVTFREPEISGLDVLTRSGLRVIHSTSGVGSAVCSIEDVGCPPSDCFCRCRGASCAYWSYWHREGNAWAYANVGAGACRVQHGDVEGWHWGVQAEPPSIPFAAICQPAPTSTPLPPTLLPPPPVPATPPPTAPPPTRPATAAPSSVATATTAPAMPSPPTNALPRTAGPAATRTIARPAAVVTSEPARAAPAAQPSLEATAWMDATPTVRAPTPEPLLGAPRRATALLTTPTAAAASEPSRTSPGAWLAVALFGGAITCIGVYAWRQRSRRGAS